MIRIFSFEHIVQAFVSLLRYSFVMKKLARKQEGRSTMIKPGSKRIGSKEFSGRSRIMFHEYYVIGLVENGERTLSCRNIQQLRGI